MTGLYARVTISNTAARFEVMHDGDKICDMPFNDLADFCVYLLDLLTEKRASYEIAIGDRLFVMTWQQVHSALEQIAGSLRFEMLPR